MPQETGDRGAGGEGTVVLEDGLAVLHRGEVVLAAPQSEAKSEQAMDDARALVHFHFPVEIEVRGAPEPADPALIAEEALLGLARGIANS